jgi:hypothetical protein
MDEKRRRGSGAEADLMAAERRKETYAQKRQQQKDGNENPNVQWRGAGVSRKRERYEMLQDQKSSRKMRST